MVGLKLKHVSKRGPLWLYNRINVDLRDSFTHPRLFYWHWESINSLVPGICGYYIKLVIFKLVSRINILSISCEIVLRWTPQDLTDDKSTLLQVMARCRQATSHYLSQCWPRSLSPYGVTRPQWVKVVPGSRITVLRWSVWKIIF